MDPETPPKRQDIKKSEDMIPETKDGAIYLEQAQAESKKPEQNSDTPTKANKSEKILQKTVDKASMLKKDVYTILVIVRTDIGMTTGKIAAQTGHAVLGIFKDLAKNEKKLLELWERHQDILVLNAKNLNDFKTLKKTLTKNKVDFYLVRDAGKTQIKSGTSTAIAVQPLNDEQAKLILEHFDPLEQK